MLKSCILLFKGVVLNVSFTEKCSELCRIFLASTLSGCIPTWLWSCALSLWSVWLSFLAKRLGMEHSKRKASPRSLLWAALSVAKSFVLINVKVLVQTVIKDL